ncbi:hypothetical protein ACWGCW_00470 [Streptomyces sp. NPDC054933]
MTPQQAAEWADREQSLIADVDRALHSAYDCSEVTWSGHQIVAYLTVMAWAHAQAKVGPFTVVTAAEARVHARIARLSDAKQVLYLLAFRAGECAYQAGEDTARTLRILLTAGDSASAAGFLEGCVSARGGVLPKRRRWRNDRRTQQREAA